MTNEDCAYVAALWLLGTIAGLLAGLVCPRQPGESGADRLIRSLLVVLLCGLCAALVPFTGG